MKEGNNIEKLFKDGFEKFEIDPGDHLWSKIQSEIPTEGMADAALKSTGTAAKAGGSWLTTVVVGGAIGLVSVAGYYYFEDQAEARKVKNESEQLIEAQNDQEIKESNTAAPKEDLETAAKSDLNIEDDARLDNPTVESTKISSSKEDSPFAEAIEESNSSTKSSANQNKADSQIKAPKQSGTKAAAGLNKAASEESRSTSGVNHQQSGNAIAEDPSKNDLENNTSSTVESQTSTDPNQNTDLPEKNINENKGGNTNSGSFVNPPSNSVDETPGIIEAYKPPNIFTPNGDGNNDVFRVDIEKIVFDEIEVRIFSRSGDLMHSWKGEFGYWDGKARNGSNAPEGPYPYTVIIKRDGKVYTKKGFVTLSRGQ